MEIMKKLWTNTSSRPVLKLFCGLWPRYLRFLKALPICTMQMDWPLIRVAVKITQWADIPEYQSHCSMNVSSQLSFIQTASLLPNRREPCFCKAKRETFCLKIFQSRTSNWNWARVCPDWVMIPICFLFIVFFFIYTWEEPNKKDKRLPGHQTALTKQHFNDLKVGEREHVDCISPKIGTSKNEKRGTFGVLLCSKYFKMFSKSRRQLYSYIPGVNDQLFSTELSRIPHCVCGFSLPWGREKETCPVTTCLGR